MTAPIRVLHIAAGNLFGGVESLLVTFARERARCPDMQPEFAVCFSGRLHQALASAGTPPLLLPEPRASRPWSVWRARRALERHLRDHRPDAVVCHAPWAHAMFAPVGSRASLPVIFWQHGPASGHWLERWARRTPPDLGVATSHFVAGSLSAVFPDAPTAVIYPPVPAPPAPAAGTRQQLRAALGASDGDAVIVQVARMEAWKGHRALIAALSNLPARAAWRCWLVGGAQRPDEQRYLDQLRSEAAALNGRVTFLGERTDVPDVLAAADLYCQPNLAPEPFGIALVEALYAGLPVVTSAMGGAAEIVDNSCGVGVPAGDKAALIAALTRLTTDADARQRLGRAAPARAAILCDPARQLGRLAEIARTLASGTLTA